MVDSALISFMHSPWSPAGVVLTNGSKIPLNGRDYWAPDINFVNGKYVLYYSLSSKGNPNSTSGLATNPSMESGTWTDHGEVFKSVEGQSYNASACLIGSPGLSAKTNLHVSRGQPDPCR